MAAEAMRDIGSDEDVSDTEDPDLLAELQDLQEEDTPPPPVQSKPSPAAPPTIQKPEVNTVSLLEDRLNMYKSALENAKSAGDASKQRRLDRGVKVITLYNGHIS